MLFLTIVLLGSAISLTRSMNQNIKEMLPKDIQLASEVYISDKDVMTVLTENGFETDKLKNVVSFNAYDPEGLTMGATMGKYIESILNYYTFVGEDTDETIMALSEYNKNIAYVSQDNYLFDMSVMENILLGNPMATDAEVMDAAKACGCHDFIMNLENGYQTVCGGAGGHLSGGERQRISIARAMLKDAPVVILDEATAYTDPENEALVQQSVAKLVRGRTLLVIAHRLSTIASADQIILINNGRVEASGTQQELLDHCDLYRSMWHAHIAAKEAEDVA